VRETKILLALTYALAIAACLPTPFAPSSEPSAEVSVLLTEPQTQPWNALSDYLLK
jgi:hypothetical protein